MATLPKSNDPGATLSEPLLASSTGRWVVPSPGKEITATGRENWGARAKLGRALGIRREETVGKVWQAIARVIAEGRTEAITLPANSDGESYLVLIRPARESGFAVVTRQRVDLSQLAPPASVLVDLFGLTPTEVIVARCIVRGDELSAIAAARGNSTETIRGYVKNILRKTGCASQKQLTAMLSRLAMLASKAGEIPD
jgi:DNA-binding CsgD family transcriptional regulator